MATTLRYFKTSFHDGTYPGLFVIVDTGTAMYNWRWDGKEWVDDPEVIGYLFGFNSAEEHSEELPPGEALTYAKFIGVDKAIPESP